VGSRKLRSLEVAQEYIQARGKLVKMEIRLISIHLNEQGKHGQENEILGQPSMSISIANN
jgi:hypothetical protein